MSTRALVTSRQLGEVPLSDLCWHEDAGLAGIDEKGAVFRWTPAETLAAEPSGDLDTAGETSLYHTQQLGEVPV